MGYIVVDIRRLHTPPMKSEDETTTIRTSEVEVIKHRIYEVRGLRLKSQIVTSSLEMTNIENNIQFAVKNFDRKTGNC